MNDFGRYWAVTNVDYIHSRTSNRVLMMIFFVWISAVIVSLAPQFGWKDAEYMQRIEQQKCMVSQDIGYQVILLFKQNEKMSIFFFRKGLSSLYK